MQLQIKHQLRAQFDEIEDIIISPTMKFRQWRIAVKCKSSFHVGRSMNGEVVILDTFNRVPVPDTEIMKIAKQDENISAFLSFSLSTGGKWINTRIIMKCGSLICATAAKVTILLSRSAISTWTTKSKIPIPAGFSVKKNCKKIKTRLCVSESFLLCRAWIIHLCRF